MGEKREHWLPMVQVDFNTPVREDGRAGTTFKTWFDTIKVGDIVFQACIEEYKGDGELFGVLARVTKKSFREAAPGSFGGDRYFVYSRPLAWDSEDVVDAAEVDA